MEELSPSDAVSTRTLLIFLITVRNSIETINEQFIEKALNDEAEVLDVHLGLFCEHVNVKTANMVEDCIKVIQIEAKSFYTMDDIRTFSAGLFDSLYEEAYKGLDEVFEKLNIEQNEGLMKDVGGALIDCYLETKDLLMIQIFQDEENKDKLMDFFEENGRGDIKDF